MDSLKIAIFKEARLHHSKSAGLTDEQLNGIIFHSGTGLRLNFEGFLILKNIFTVYSFEMPTNLKSKHHIGMSVFEYPYYVTTKRLILFSELDAMTVKLCGGIEKFLENQYEFMISVR